MEADTIIISIYSTLRENGFRGSVVIDSADTDVYTFAAYVSHQYPENLLIMRRQEFIDCRKLVENHMVDSIIPLHIITGCDSTSAFFGKGKRNIFKKVCKSERARLQLKYCGKELEIKEESIQQLMSFTREVIYADLHTDSKGMSRAMKWQSKKNKSFCTLPPDEDSLRNHIERCNYLAYIIMNPCLKNHPSPLGKGWELDKGVCKPQKYENLPLPKDLPGLTTEEDELQIDVNSDDDTDESSDEYDSSSDSD